LSLNPAINCPTRTSRGLRLLSLLFFSSSALRTHDSKSVLDLKMSQNRPAAFSSLRMGGETTDPNLYRRRLLTRISRGYSRKGPRWGYWRDSRYAIHTMQDCRKWIIRCRFSDQALALGRGCGYQARVTRQEIQGERVFGFQNWAILTSGRTVSCRSCALSDIRISWSSRPFTTPMARE
jgi:hypothetical protein